MGDGVFAFLRGHFRIAPAQLLGMDEEDLTRQEGFQLRIGFIYQIFRTEHCSIYFAYNPFQESYVAVIGRDGTLPVPLVNIERVQIAQNLIGPYGIHIGIDPIARGNLVFGKRETLPFGKRMDHLGFGIVQILYGKCDGTLNTAQVVVDTHAFEDEKRGGDTPQLKSGG